PSTRPLHDALPISGRRRAHAGGRPRRERRRRVGARRAGGRVGLRRVEGGARAADARAGRRAPAARHRRELRRAGPCPETRASRARALARDHAWPRRAPRRRRGGGGAFRDVRAVGDRPRARRAWATPVSGRTGGRAGGRRTTMPLMHRRVFLSEALGAATGALARPPRIGAQPPALSFATSRGAPRLRRGAAERWGVLGAISGPPMSIARRRRPGR